MNVQHPSKQPHPLLPQAPKIKAPAQYKLDKNQAHQFHQLHHLITSSKELLASHHFKAAYYNLNQAIHISEAKTHIFCKQEAIARVLKGNLFLSFNKPENAIIEYKKAEFLWQNSRDLITTYHPPQHPPHENPFIPLPYLKKNDAG